MAKYTLRGFTPAKVFTWEIKALGGPFATFEEELEARFSQPRRDLVASPAQEHETPLAQPRKPIYR